MASLENSGGTTYVQRWQRTRIAFYAAVVINAIIFFSFCMLRDYKDFMIKLRGGEIRILIKQCNIVYITL